MLFVDRYGAASATPPNGRFGSTLSLDLPELSPFIPQ